jgi:hypothetical protein
MLKKDGSLFLISEGMGEGVVYPILTIPPSPPCRPPGKGGGGDGKIETWIVEGGEGGKQDKTRAEISRGRIALPSFFLHQLHTFLNTPTSFFIFQHFFLGGRGLIIFSS